LTFTLREGLKYSDGSLLNAKRFEYSLFRNIDPATAGEYAAITDDILGAVEWRVSPHDEHVGLVAHLLNGLQRRAHISLELVEHGTDVQRTTDTEQCVAIRRRCSRFSAGTS
jgi:hypothetical protein